MLKIVLNILQPQADEITAEEQAGFRAGRSTAEQIFNLRILYEKIPQHKQNLYHVFEDFKKAFDGVRHEALWATMDDHEGSISIGGRLNTDFRCADDIVLNAEEEEEADVLMDRIDTATTSHKMETGPDKTKVMTSNPNGFQRDIKIRGQRLETVDKKKTSSTSDQSSLTKVQNRDCPDNSSSF